ncbi:MAG: hypothetical protein GWN14_27985 [candidate division Zixibacteria bacterium]|nr:sulfotransferase [candidate division Zixibacteria bacterium]NIW50273.1 hypothetical protein [Gammaproteobacteria bacterium]NIX59660.1 hypothetical protein [candidate division Zixibacteria bacterium]
MEKTIIIGYGTGRCGTKSLATFLSMQPQPACHVTHEGLPMSWYPAVANMRDTMTMLESYPGHFVGDVGFYWINHLDYLFEKYPEAKVINIYRDDDETINSFCSRVRLKKLNGKNYNRGGWYDYPFDSDSDTDQDIVRTIYRYRYLEKIVAMKYPGKIFCLRLDLFNNMAHMARLLEWIGFERPYHLEPCHEHRT